MASEMPARTLRVENRKGRLVAGADADWLLLADDLELSAVYRAGELVV
jgi:N-acetylglucosamine-6-phosphate deacetylase